MRVVIGVDGMSCQGCVSSLTKAFARAGISATVELGRVELEVADTAEPTVEKAREAISRAGYTPLGVTPE